VKVRARVGLWVECVAVVRAGLAQRCYGAYRVLCLPRTMPTAYYAYRVLCLPRTMPTAYYAYRVLCLPRTMPSANYSPDMVTTRSGQLRLRGLTEETSGQTVAHLVRRAARRS